MSQKENKEEALVVLTDPCEILPTFVEGEEALFRFLADSMRYPTIDMEGIPDGKVIVRFVIDEEGHVCEPTIIRSLHPLLDEEAIRVVKLLPKWNPAMQNGVPVRSYFTLPFLFKKGGRLELQYKK